MYVYTWYDFPTICISPDLHVYAPTCTYIITHTHTHTHVYIYIYPRVTLTISLADRKNSWGSQGSSKTLPDFHPTIQHCAPPHPWGSSAVDRSRKPNSKHSLYGSLSEAKSTKDTNGEWHNGSQWHPISPIITLESGKWLSHWNMLNLRIFGTRPAVRRSSWDHQGGAMKMCPFFLWEKL